MKWIFVGGKGGVGKTTTSCSLAVQFAKRKAEEGKSVLLISTDPAHNLSDAFSQHFGKKETQVQGLNNLYAMEIDPEIDLGKKEEDFFGLGEKSSFLTEISKSIPGIDEAFAFAELMRRVSKKEHDLIVFDTAPTGHTLRLLSFPTTLEQAFEKFDQIKNKFGGIFSHAQTLLQTMSQSQTNLPSQKQILQKFDLLKKTVKDVKQQFQDADRTTFVCVCIPEFLSLYETERLVQTLTKYNIDCHNIVINQILYPIEFKCPKNVNGILKIICDRHIARIKMQQKYINQFHDLYEDFHLVQVPLLNQEVRQLERLISYGEMLLNAYVPEY